MFQIRKTRLLVQSLSLRKIWNFLLIVASFHISRWMGKAWHKGNPVKLGFEPTTYCNLRCPECPSGLRAFNRPTGMLELDLYRKAIDQVYKDLVFLLLYFQGEPYLHPDFLKMVQYAREKGIYTATSTNGHYLTPKRAKETVESGISEVLISIDGTTQESYQSYRKGGKLEKVKEGVRNLVAARAEKGSLYPLIIIQFLVVKPNEHQIEDIQALGKDLGVDHVALKTAQIYDYQHGHPLIPSQTQYSRYKQLPDGTYTVKNKLDNQCWKLWHGAEISWDGRVLPCCFDKDADYEMGSLQEAGFAQIWRNKSYQQFRNRLLKSRSEIDICQNCTEGTKVWA